jgi:CRP-like cAMP-binding protein
VPTLEPIIAELPLFQGMKPGHIQLITGCAANVRFEAGEYVGREGEPANRFWAIRQGRVALEIHAPGRGAVTIQTIGEGDVAGWSWLVPPHQLHFDARALTLTRAVELDARCLRGKFSRDPELGYELLRRFSQVIAQRLEAMSLQILDIYGDHD